MPPFRIIEGGLRCFHKSRAPALAADCAYCGTQLHVHQDDLGRVKSGRHDVGYLVEKCPACHRPNAVFPAYGIGGIRAQKLSGVSPAMQMKIF